MTENEIIINNMALVKFVVNKFKPKSDEDYEDYLQIGRIALLKAYRKFDEKRGKFSTLAHKIITNDLLRHIQVQKRQKNHLILSEKIEKMYQPSYNIDMAIDEAVSLSPTQKNIILMKMNGFTRKEISNILNTSKKSVNEAINLIQDIVKN